MTIFGHVDYREWLRARFEERARGRSSQSLAAFARRCGVSRAFISLVFARKRHVGFDSVPKISKALGMNSIEKRIFIAAVGVSACGDQETKNYFRSILAAVVYEEQHLKDWPARDLAVHARIRVLDFILLEMIRGCGEFRTAGDFEKQLSPSMPATAVAIQAALERLEQGGFALVDDSGVYRWKKALKFKVDPEGLLGFELFQESLEIHSRGLAQLHPNPRSAHYAGAFAVDRQKQQELFRIHGEFRERVSALADVPCEDGQAVFWLSTHLTKTTAS